MVLETMDHCADEICKAFRVSKLLVKGFADATYLNAPESRKFFMEDVIMPRAVEYQNVINQDLVNQVDPGVEFEFAFEEIPLLKEDSTAKEARLASMYDKGIISAEYYRQEMGIEESAKGDEKLARETQAAENKWEKKAVKALLRGEDPNVSFDTDHIEIDRQYIIHGRLMNASTEAEVKEAFRR
jgi:phage portal protein BeeE